MQSVPSCPANNNVVKFLPGTYNDAAAMSTLMNGISCPGRTFWFSPGVYYFDFANGGVNGNHEWRINDSNGKVVAGQPNAVSSGSTPVGPVPVTATGASTSSPGFTGPTDAILIGGNLATTGNLSTSGQQRWLRANGYSMAQSPIPPGSSAPVVQLHVVHGESWDTAGSSGTVTGWVTPNAPTPTAGNPCATIPTGSALASTPFCLSADARTNNNTGAVARFANAGTTTRSITLANGWAGSALPAGATVTGVTAQVKHRESTAAGAITPSLSGTASGGCTITSTNLPPRWRELRRQPVALPACVNNAISSLSLQYGAATPPATGCPTGNTNAKQALLDSIELTVNYTVPAPVTPQFGSVQVQVLNDADNANLAPSTWDRPPTTTSPTQPSPFRPVACRRTRSTTARSGSAIRSRTGRARAGVRTSRRSSTAWSS